MLVWVYVSLHILHRFVFKNDIGVFHHLPFIFAGKAHLWNLFRRHFAYMAKLSKLRSFNLMKLRHDVQSYVLNQVT